jgi:hypothetical protein
MRIENATQNFASLRCIAMNLIKRDTNTKTGLKMRRLKAAPTIDIAPACSACEL